MSLYPPAYTRKPPPPARNDHMKILHIDSNIQADFHNRTLSVVVAARSPANVPQAVVARRDLNLAPITHVSTHHTEGLQSLQLLHVTLASLEDGGPHP